MITELPSYPGALDADPRQRRPASCRCRWPAAGGWDVGQLQAALRQTLARLAYLIPDFHNPTGALIGAERPRRACCGPRGRPARPSSSTSRSSTWASTNAARGRRAALDPAVVTIGSLSKPVWGGLRIGWIRASAELVRRLAALRATIDMAGSVLDQLVAAALFARLDEIAAHRRAQLRPRRDALLAALARELPSWRAPGPQGGLSLWAELDAPLSTPLTLLAAQAGVLIVPGSRFGVDGTLERFLRLPFALPAPQLDEAVTPAGAGVVAAWTVRVRRNATLVVA